MCFAGAPLLRRVDDSWREFTEVIRIISGSALGDLPKFTLVVDPATLYQMVSFTRAPVA